MREFERAVAAALGPLRRERLLVTVSGGGDSVALLRALHALGVDVVAAHCNFHLRGAESDRDQAAVEELCRGLGVPLEVVHFDVAASRLAGESDEMTCRRLRYGWFDELSARRGCARTVTGHNADDNAETLLLNLMRGSGVRGLRGMLPDTGRVLRPLLSLSRRDITGYLDALGQGYVTDSTNLESDYRRNFVRLEVLPLLESRWPGARTALQRTLGCLRADERIVRRALGDALAQVRGGVLPMDTIRDFADPATLLLEYTAPHGGTPEMALEMARALGAPRGQRWALDACEAVLLADGLHIDSTAGEPAPLVCERVEMTPAATQEMRRRGCEHVLWLPRPLSDYVVRPARPGDRMSPLGMKGSRLLSDIMKEARVPVSHRQRLRVVEDPATGRIIWLEGLRRSRHQLVDGPVAWRVTSIDN